MANNEFTIPIPARLKNVAKGGHVAGAEDIIDDALGKEQSVINQEVSEAIEGNTEAVAAERQRAETAEGALDTRLSDVEELAEISIDGGEAKIATGEDFHNPTAEKRAKVTTVGAILDGADDEPTPGSKNLVKSGGVHKDKECLYVEGAYITVNNINSVIGSVVQSPSYKYSLVSCTSGDIFRVAGVGTAGAARVWFTLNKNMIVKRAASVASLIEGIDITIQDGEYFIGTNSTINAAYSCFYIKSTQVEIERNLITQILKAISFTGYYNCTTASNVANKEIKIPFIYESLLSNIRLRIRMAYNNTVDSDVNLVINDSISYPLYYNRRAVSSTNTWGAGEELDVSFSTQLNRFEANIRCNSIGENINSSVYVPNMALINDIIDNINSRVGITICKDGQNVNTKVIQTGSGASYSNSMLCICKFLNKNASDDVNVKLGNNNLAAKPFYLNGIRVSSINTWKPKDTLLVWYNPESDIVDSIIISSEYIISIGTYIDDTYLYRNGKPSGVSANFKCTDFIAVIPGTQIKIDNLSAADYTMVHFYNVDKDWVGSVESESQTSIVSTTIVEIPLNTKYIRYSIRTTQSSTNTVEYVSDVTDKNLSNTLVNNWFNAAHNKITNLFKKCTKRPLITIIDDDTPSAEGVARMKGLCDDLDIKCTFACLTRQIDLHSDLGTALLNYELEGYQTVIHGYSQNAYYQDYENHKAECEIDFVTGLRKLQTMGFLDYKYWVTPYGADSEGIQQLAKKYDIKCLCTVKPGFETTKAEKGKYALKRTGLNATDAEGSTTLAGLKVYIDECALVNGWIIIETHIANGWEGNDYSRFNEIVNYAKAKGFTFTTLAEAWNERKYIYDLYDMF